MYRFLLAASLLFVPFHVNAEDKPNIIYFLVDNLGIGEISSFAGGPLRGVETPRIDDFADEGFRLLNFAPETQCTPSRSALMTGRYSIRSGTHTVALAGDPGGLVTWERTIADILSDEGYATSIVGKWHIGASAGRWPTDHGFDEWIGIPHSYDEALWADDPWYDSNRDPVAYVVESEANGDVKELEQLTVDVKLNIDVEYLRRSKSFIDRSVAAKKPFYLYFNHSLMHLPVQPREEFRGHSGSGPWADSLAQLDADFGELLDYLEEKGIADNTIVVFSGDNGPEENQGDRGHAGYWQGSYFTGMEGSLRTPAAVRYPDIVRSGQVSDEIVHITDMFTTLVRWAGADVPTDREIDGRDQRAFLEGREESSARDGFPYWMGERMYGVKWRNFKVVSVLQRTFTEPAQQLAIPYIINLDVDPQERGPYNYPHMHSWVLAHVGKIVADFQQSVSRETPIRAGAPLDFVPQREVSFDQSQ
jgi:arylsulfatase